MHIQHMIEAPPDMAATVMFLGGLAAMVVAFFVLIMVLRDKRKSKPKSKPPSTSNKKTMRRSG